MDHSKSHTRIVSKSLSKSKCKTGKKKLADKSTIGVSKFKTNRFKLEKVVRQVPSSSATEIHNSAFYMDAFPPLPKPSAELKQLLITFNEASKNVGHGNGRIKTRIPRKLTSFIAFRSFYSRFIKGAEHQRQLSSSLAQIWKTELNKDAWKRYAFEYSEVERKKGFVEWLCDKLNIHSNKLENLKIIRNKETGIDDLILI